MIKRAKYALKLTRAEYTALAKIRDWSGKQWDSPPNEEIRLIKDKIRTQLKSSQSVCSYCGLKLFGTSSGEIEHIAPKATGYRHPEFTFTLKNLTLSCHWCNTSEKKGTKETISVKHKLYSRCIFNIVHPYFDNPEDHYDWTDKNLKILIQVKNNSQKAKNSIDIFKLDTPEMNEHRAQQLIYEKFKSIYPISADHENLLKSALLNFKE